MIDWPATLARHDRWLRTVLFARLGERHSVDEVMQEVSLAAVAHRMPFCDPSRIGAWLYRVAIRQALLFRRKRGRQQRMIDGYAGSNGSLPPQRQDPLDLLLLDERRSLIREALAKLDHRDAEILLLKYTEGWSGMELAERLGVSASCTEARLHRARQRLRDAVMGLQIIEVQE
jgi:RNA polymerase sigma-70 factor (ECF subfamily)